MRIVGREGRFSAIDGLSFTTLLDQHRPEQLAIHIPRHGLRVDVELDDELKIVDGRDFDMCAGFAELDVAKALLWDRFTRPGV